MRPRSPKHRGLEPNLYFHSSSGLYCYKHPVTGKFHYLTRDKQRANVAARKLNAILVTESGLEDKVLQPRLRFVKIIDYYEQEVLA